jgi:two-component system, NtrC family, response regulator HydG
MQVKLLRVLEERAIEPLGSNRRVNVDMRVLCATNQNLADCLAEGRMRQDFFYRINVMPLDLPPLRARRSDIPLLVADFLRNHALARQKGIDSVSNDALDLLVGHRWPGNVRELLNVLERAVLRTKGTTIVQVDVPPAAMVDGEGITAGFDEALRTHMREAERDYLARLLRRFGGCVTTAARHAGVDQATLHRKLRAHGIDANVFRKAGQRGEGAAA